jgi:hypothetical protein
MQTGLHAVGWGLQRVSIGIGVAVLAAGLAYIGLVLVIVVIQSVAAFGTAS